MACLALLALLSAAIESLAQTPPPATRSMVLSQPRLLFTAVEGSGQLATETFAVINPDQGMMNWRAQAGNLESNLQFVSVPWLSVTPGNGSSVASSLQVPMVEVHVDVTALRQGQYRAQVRVEAPAELNAGIQADTQYVSVELNVLPAGSNPGVRVRPTGLVFTAQAGGAVPGAQVVQLSTTAPGVVEATVIPTTIIGGDWLTATPASVTFSSAEPKPISIQAQLGALAPGRYFGVITLLFSDRTSQTVNTLFVVVPRPTAACAPTRLVAQSNLGTNFTAQTGFPTPLRVEVRDDCGNMVSNATVTASFSNGDTTLALPSTGSGIYNGNWTPSNTAAQVAVTVRAVRTPLAQAEVISRGQVIAGSPNNPRIFPGAVVDGASFAVGRGVAPGSIVSVFGANMTPPGMMFATRIPLPTQLFGARVKVANTESPMFFASPQQLNVQLPRELPLNTQQPVVVELTLSGGQTISSGTQTISVVPTSPGIFSVFGGGSGPQQGAILDSSFRLAGSANPAGRGSVVAIFCTGLGETNPPVNSGYPTPSSPLARVTNPVNVRIGGVPAEVLIAVLSPGFAGLFQVNVRVPQTVTPGNAVPVILTVGGVDSQTVTMGVR